MTVVQIPNLPPVSPSLSPNALFEIVQAGVSYKATIADIAALIIAGDVGFVICFATRDEFSQSVSMGFSVPDGIIVSAAGFFYIRNSASSSIPDIPGYDPSGTASMVHFGIVGIGDETSKVQAAFNFVVDGTLLGVPGITVNYTTVIIASQGIIFDSLGMTFARISNSGTFAFQVGGNFVANDLRLTAPGGATNYNLLIRGSNVSINGLSVYHTAQTDQTGSAVGLWAKQDSLLEISNIRLTDLSFVNVSRPVYCANVNGLVIDGLTSEKYRTGVYLSDCRQVSLANGHTFGLSIADNGSPGENSILLESTVADATSNVVISNWLAEDSGEHGFRVGGQRRISNVTFNDCIAIRPGSAILGGNTSGGIWNGGCGFKVQGGTSVGGERHRAVTLNNCTVYDVNQTFGSFPTGHGVNNFTPFLIVAADDTTLNECRVLRKTEPYSCYQASIFTAVNGLQFNNCEFRDCSAITIRPYQAVVDPVYPGQTDPILNFQVNGGLYECTALVNGICVYYSEATTAANDVFILNNPTLIGGDTAIRFFDPDVSGSFSNVVLNYVYLRQNASGPMQAGVGLQGALTTAVGVHSSSNVAANGSQITDRATGVVYVRLAGAWQPVITCTQSAYTPTATPVTNLTAFAASFAYYTRIGNVVNMFGTVTITPTASGSIIGEITLPIASNFSGTRQAAGTFVASDGTIQGMINAQATNDTLQFVGTSTVTTAKTINYIASYAVI